MLTHLKLSLAVIFLGFHHPNVLGVIQIIRDTRGGKVRHTVSHRLETLFLILCHMAQSNLGLN